MMQIKYQINGFQPLLKQYRFSCMKGNLTSSKRYSYLKRFRKLENKNIKTRLDMMAQAKKINRKDKLQEKRYKTSIKFDESSSKISVFNKLKKQFKKIQGNINQFQLIKQQIREQKEKVLQKFVFLRRKNSLLIEPINEEKLPRTLSLDLSDVFERESKKSFSNYSNLMQNMAEQNKVFCVPYHMHRKQLSTSICKNLQFHRTNRVLNVPIKSIRLQN